MTHKNLLKLVGYSQSKEDNLCGDFNKLTAYVEFYFHDLEKELDRRFPKKVRITRIIDYIIDQINNNKKHLVLIKCFFHYSNSVLPKK
jgi:hypothetical protein